ncbi:MAG: hypothetical protein WBW85_01410 [Terriglobales bacterium]
MKYETPELTALMPAINAVQSPVHKTAQIPTDGLPMVNDVTSAYEDWE